MSKEYTEKLKDPRWQKKRLQILERDGWVCQSCYDYESTLVVHHKNYLPNTDPWDYPDELLITLCEECHELEGDTRPSNEKLLIDALRQTFLTDALLDFAKGISLLKPLHVQEVVASAYSWAFSSPEMQRNIIECYFEEILKRHEPITEVKAN